MVPVVGRFRSYRRSGGRLSRQNLAVAKEVVTVHRVSKAVPAQE